MSLKRFILSTFRSHLLKRKAWKACSKLRGILGTFKMAEHSCPSPQHSKPCILSSFQHCSNFPNLGPAVFKLPDLGANIYVQSFLKFPSWDSHGSSKSPPHRVSTHLSGITFGSLTFLSHGREVYCFSILLVFTLPHLYF